MIPTQITFGFVRFFLFLRSKFFSVTFSSFFTFTSFTKHQFPLTMEPTYQQSSIQPPQPKNWLVESILVTIFCCLPFGIAGIVNAAQVSNKYLSGDYDGALRSSNEAGKWTKIGFFVGISLHVLSFILFFVFGFGGFWTSHSYYNRY